MVCTNAPLISTEGDTDVSFLQSNGKLTSKLLWLGKVDACDLPDGIPLAPMPSLDGLDAKDVDNFAHKDSSSLDDTFPDFALLLFHECDLRTEVVGIEVAPAGRCEYLFSSFHVGLYYLVTNWGVSRCH
jgi:hypothetical protein